LLDPLGGKGGEDIQKILSIGTQRNHFERGWKCSCIEPARKIGLQTASHEKFRGERGVLAFGIWLSSKVHQEKRETASNTTERCEVDEGTTTKKNEWKEEITGPCQNEMELKSVS